MERLQEWRFDVERLRLSPGDSLSRSDQPMAVRCALRQLDAHLNAPAPIIELARGWRITSQLISAVATALPAQSSLRLSVAVTTLSAGRVRKIGQMGPRVVGVSGQYGYVWANDQTCAIRLPGHVQWSTFRAPELTPLNFNGMVGLLTMLNDGVQRTFHVDSLQLGEDVIQVGAPLTLACSTSCHPLRYRHVALLVTRMSVAPSSLHAEDKMRFSCQLHFVTCLPHSYSWKL